MLHLLATEPPSVGRHNGDVACQQACEPQEKIMCLHCDCSLDFFWWLDFIFLIGSSPLHGGVKIKGSLLLSHKLE